MHAALSTHEPRRGWALVTRLLPPKPVFRTERQLRKLSRRDLAERCWAQDVNADFASQAAAEWQARVMELVDMLEGRREVDHTLLATLNEHRAHVIECRRGTCETDFTALVRADAIPIIFPETQEYAL